MPSKQTIIRIQSQFPARPHYRGLQVVPAKATDEIQVYNAGIAAPGQFTIQQHLNYIAHGVKTPAFPGVDLSPINSLNGTPEFAYGMTEWWELGFYLPFAVQVTSSCPTGPSCGRCSSRRTPTSATSSTASISSSAM